MVDTIARPTGGDDFLSRLAIAESNDNESARVMQEIMDASVSLDDMALTSTAQEPRACIGDSRPSSQPTRVKMIGNMSLTHFDFVHDDDEARKMCSISLGGSRHKIGGKTLTVQDGGNAELCTSLFSAGSLGKHVRLTVMRGKPAFGDQASEAMQMGSTIKLDRYAFAQIAFDNRPSLKSSVTATYSLVTEGGALAPLYRARRFHSMRFVAVVETMDGTAVAKFTQPVMPSKLTIHKHATLEIAAGVDAAAIALLGTSIVADWASASTRGGAAKLIGAGVA